MNNQLTPIKPPINVDINPAVALGKFISTITFLLITLASIWVLFQLLQAGLEWIGSGGDKTGLENAKNRIINALIGLFIVFSAWTIYLLVVRFLGLSPLGAEKIYDIIIPTL